ncbi:hypothetical protein EF912_02400 [Streptomyces sp. WAC07061]|uniref:sensor histidine kinase n=1 Tax=Streptomyces sp. WAC07061 TaxID=2487410 RepID=UPI000F7827F4|nr:histidine kinase [Streptomyces sp. WAC07061]RSS64121.1 hypothetical protein EF912_02400 [Streptomyces sp. WAC07061]
MMVTDSYGEGRIQRLGALGFGLTLLAGSYAVIREHPAGLLPSGVAWPALLALAVTAGLLIAGQWHRWPFALTATAASVLSGVPFPMMLAIYALLRTGHRRAGLGLAVILATSGFFQDTFNVLMRRETITSNVAHGTVEALLTVLAALSVSRQGQLAAAREELRAAAERDRAQRLRLRTAEMAHDGVGHRISLMLLQSGAIELTAAPDQDDVRARCAAIHDAGRAAMAELGEVVEVLRDGEASYAVAAGPGFEDLDALVDVYRLHDQDVELRCTVPDARSMPPKLQEAAYRVVEEGLANVLRHANGAPTQAVCAMSDDRTTLVAEVANAAPPVRRAPVLPGTGTGIDALAERLTGLGGSLTARHTPDGGHLLRAELPLPAHDTATGNS